jgi:C4-dicarboxylate-specific signal transduction histidine kinase
VVELLPESWSRERDTLTALGVRSVVCLPMVVGGATIAFMGLVSTSRRVQWSDDTVQQMLTLGEVFANGVARQSAVLDLERSAAALEEAQRDLAHVTRATTMGELAASIAHEINQPLAAIVANAGACLNWLSSEAPDLAAVRRVLGRMAADGDRAGQVLTRIRSLLARSRVEMVRCDLSAVVDGVLPLLRGQLRHDGVSLEACLASELPAVMGDPVQLQQVVLNLVLNAAEASRHVAPERRQVTVRATADHAARQVVVSVEDAGAGFDGQPIERLFETFYTTKPTGLGMGLAISRSIIERHQGRLWAEANVPHGATFRFALEAVP